ncbi:MAG: phosphotransferase [Halarcobacter sp.]
MGVITRVSIEQINELIKKTNIKFISLQETKNGITDSTYLGTSVNMTKYIFKIFENSTLANVKNKVSILESIKDLKVPKVISKEIVLYENKPTILFSFIEGKIAKKITLKEIEEITTFLFKLHSKKNIKTSNENIYTKDYFEKMLNKTADKNLKLILKNKYQVIRNIDLENNSLIHGDLFPDNAKFIDGKLSGVYDFAQASFGNDYFDLAVLIISWCFDEYTFNERYFEKILEVYSKNRELSISKDEIKEYLLFACLYYTVQRITRENKMKDYKEYQIKFDILENLFNGTNK